MPEKSGTESFRGRNLNDEFIDKFKQSLFYSMYLSHQDELILGIRDGYINLYYNCDSIAKINCDSSILRAEVDCYFTPNGETLLSDTEFEKFYDHIKKQSDKRRTPEKKSQSQLFIQNNQNKTSEWFCVDLEYTKTYGGLRSNWRYDIIAVSKSAPYKVALIELKYGAAAIGGTSGIRSHIADFHDFFVQSFNVPSSFDILKPELLSIIKAQSALGVIVPEPLMSATINDFESLPSYYVITLNNIPQRGDNSATPKMSMSGYLFSDRRWGCRRVSSDVKEFGDYFKIIGFDKEFTTHFLFSEASLPQLGIIDILNDKSYSEEIIKLP